VGGNPRLDTRQTQMKLKNISNRDLKFEGFELKAGETSLDVEGDRLVRLLALYEGWCLVRAEEVAEQQVTRETRETTESEVIDVNAPITNEEAPVLNTCGACGKTFATSQGLLIHTRRVHK
jgi:hypothetical protein